jgi:hypothetical protein
VSAALTIAGAVLLALGAYAGPAVLALAVAAVQVGFVVGWFRAFGLPSWRAGSVLAVLAALGASLGVLLDDVTARVAPLVAAIGLVTVAALLQELLRRDGRAHVVRSLSATVTAAAFAVLGACWVAQSESRAGETVVAAAVAAVAATVAGMVAATALLARLRLPAVPLAAVGMIIGTLAAAVVGWTDDAVGFGAGLVIGLISAVAAAVGGVVARFLSQEPQHPETVAATSPAKAPPSPPSPPSADAVTAPPSAEPAVAVTSLPQQAIAGSLPLLLAAPLAFVVASIVVD